MELRKDRDVDRSFSLHWGKQLAGAVAHERVTKLR